MQVVPDDAERKSCAKEVALSRLACRELARPYLQGLLMSCQRLAGCLF